MSFNALHVPLVYNSHHVLALGVIKVSEDSFISQVNYDILLLRSNNIEHGNQKVGSTSIHRLSKCLTSSHVKSVKEILPLSIITGGIPMKLIISSPKHGVRIHIRLGS